MVNQTPLMPSFSASLRGASDGARSLLTYNWKKNGIEFGQTLEVISAMVKEAFVKIWSP